MKERFVREARAANALNHPNITTIYEIDKWHGQDFICMEYVECEAVKKNLGRLRKPCRKPVPEKNKQVEKS